MTSIASGMTSNTITVKNHTNKPNTNLTKAERKKLQLKEKEERKALQLEAFNKKQEMKELKNQSKDYKLSKEAMSALDRMKIVLNAQFDQKLHKEKWEQIYATAAKIEENFGSILTEDGGQEWTRWLKNMDRPPPI